MNRLLIIYSSMLLAAIHSVGAEPLTLDQALETARRNSPGLRASRLGARAAEKAIEGTGLQINPRIEFETEELSADSGDFGEAEYTIGISRQLRHSKQRKAQRVVAREAANVALKTGAAAERWLLTQVRLAFFDVLAQQEAATIQADQQELGRAFIEVAERRYAAGAGSELEVVQAKLALQEIILAQACCLGELQAAVENLAALMGVSGDTLEKVGGSFYELESTDGLTLDDAHPALLRQDAAIKETRARAELARTQNGSNLKVGAGLSHAAGSNENAIKFAISMPLDWSNKGRIQQQAILLEADAAAARRDHILRRLQADLTSNVALYGGVTKEVEIIRDELIPMAEEAYELSRTGYAAGRFSWYELIAAQQHLADIRIRFIEAFKESHFIYARILNLTGEEA